MEERRKFRRSVTKETASLENKEGKKLDSQLLDVSPGGMRIFADTDIKIGSRLRGSFKIMPKSGHFYVSGEVAWVKKAAEAPGQSYEVGVKFKKVSAIPID